MRTDHTYVPGPSWSTGSKNSLLSTVPVHAITVRPVEHPGFIPGRVGAIGRPGDDRIGTLGEVHPEVLENYGLKHPVALFELSLARLLA